MKKFHKILMCLIFSVFLLAGMISSASALPIEITPATLPQWSGSSPVNPDENDIPGIVGYGGTLDELYKQDVGAASDTGPFASSYTTTFANLPLDPEDADIVYDGGAFITGSPLYLLVKDGNSDPRWYIFDLLNLGGDSWDGMMTLQLRDFWPSQGAISHVSIYGGEVPIPEPTTVLLVGFGLIGLAGFGRKKFFKK
jgi:hypothetical protein